MAEELKMLIGTYTENSSSKGIYFYSFSQENSESKEISTIMVGNPSFLAISEKKTNFYSVNEYNTGKQAVSSFLLHNNEMTKLKEIHCGFKGKSGVDPCNLLIFNDYLISLNYTGGSFTLFELDSGSKDLTKSVQYFSFSEKSHFHCAVLSPDKKYIFISIKDH